MSIILISCETHSKTSNEMLVNEAVKDSTTSVEPIVIDTLASNRRYLILGKKGNKVGLAPLTPVHKDSIPAIMGDYIEDVSISETVDTEHLEIYIRYRPKTKFEDYPAEIYNGPLAAPDFGSNPEAKNYITRIKNGCKDLGVNFAGHFTLITWGCGSPCQGGALVNRKTGAIYSGYGTALGSDFRKDSKMIILNYGAIDLEKERIRCCVFCEVTHEVWDGTKFIKVE